MIVDEHTEELEAGDSLHFCTIDLSDIERELVVLAPCGQDKDLLPVGVFR